MKISNKDVKHIREVLNEVRERMIADMTKNFKLLDQDTEDNEIWYTVQIQNQDVWFWLTQQEGRWRHYTAPRGTPVASMEERVYLALVMRWS